MLLDAGFVCAVALACVAPEANAEVHYEEKIEKFDILVHGKNATAIREAIRQDKPLNFGEHTIGTTTSKMSWQRRARVSGSECRLEKVDIGLSVLISVPEWSLRDYARPDQQRNWDCIERLVTVHEHRHAEIWRETAQHMHREMTALTQPMSCSDLDQSLIRTFNEIQMRGKRRQAAFDDEERTSGRYERCVAPRKAPQSAEAKPRGPTRITQAPEVDQPVEQTHQYADPISQSRNVSAIRSEPAVQLQIEPIVWIVVVIGLLVMGYLAVMWAALRFKAQSPKSNDQVNDTIIIGVAQTHASHYDTSPVSSSRHARSPGSNLSKGLSSPVPFGRRK